MQRLDLVIFCGLAVGMLGSQSPAAQEGQAVKDELSRLEGNWQLVYAGDRWQDDSRRAIRAVRVEIKGNTHSVYFGDKQVVHDVSFTIVPTATPQDHRRHDQ